MSTPSPTPRSVPAAADLLEPSAGNPGDARPGWPELIAGLLAGAAATAVLLLARPLGLTEDKGLWGVVLSGWAGAAGLTGFIAAARLRRRPLAAFSVRATTWRWMLIGAAAGVAALVLKGLVNIAVVAMTGAQDPQGSYYDAAGAGLLPLIFTFVLLAVLTPIGEEFLFRGVIANALLRYGPVLGVVGSSAIFALFHGINLALPSAFVVGVIAAEMMRRSGSIWPAVAAHAINNLALPLFAVVLQTSGAL